jgi:hypothetical protein
VNCRVPYSHYCFRHGKKEGKKEGRRKERRKRRREGGREQGKKDERRKTSLGEKKWMHKSFFHLFFFDGTRV